MDANGNYIGTYAGVNTQWGIRPQEEAGNSGFHWLKNVRKDEAPGETFSVEWNVKDTWNTLGKGASAPTDINLRLTMLEQTDSVATTTGVPPRNKPGNPDELEYLVAHKSGDNLDSIFTSVIEPYEGQRLVTSISKVDMTLDGQTYVGNDARAVKVELADGRVDYLVYSVNDNLTFIVDKKIEFKGFFGVYSEREGIPFYSYVNDGEFIGNLNDPATASYTGTVMDFTKQMSLENDITVQFNDDFNLENLVGRFIYIQNDGIRNATYKIKGIKNVAGNTLTLDIGDITTIRS